ncbi:putative endosulphine family protein [Eutypa lata UCREL1]|uniref:mRNA stability protein n=1 Tax=Eutypa lata (strain UCR-EL1) TaxID=1287681 RepID=M7SUX8_EUTLA|nr:putative endosulphine family protein [Eutypa lata UCREL1]
MNPHQKNKIDVKSLTPDEQRLFRLYGKLPSKSDHFAKHLKERKYFDSGDYAMSKAGKGDSVDTGAVGSQHPVPENIPHLTSPNGNGQQHHPGLPTGHSQSSTGSGGNSNGNNGNGNNNNGGSSASGSPVKEASFLHRETSAMSNSNSNTTADEDKINSNNGDSAAPTDATETQAIPIRR